MKKRQCIFNPLAKGCVAEAVEIKALAYSVSTGAHVQPTTSRPLRPTPLTLLSNI